MLLFLQEEKEEETDLSQIAPPALLPYPLPLTSISVNFPQAALRTHGVILVVLDVRPAGFCIPVSVLSCSFFPIVKTHFFPLFAVCFLNP
jgi:hypothetical protein